MIEILEVWVVKFWKDEEFFDAEEFADEGEACIAVILWEAGAECHWAELIPPSVRMVH